MMKRLPGPTELLCLAGGACTTPAPIAATSPTAADPSPLSSMELNHAKVSAH